MALYKKDSPDEVYEAEGAVQDAPREEAEDAQAPAGPPEEAPPAYEAVLAPERTLARPKKKRSLKRVIIIGVILLLVALVAVNMIANAMRGPAPTPVQTMAVGRGDVVQTLSTSGILTTGEKSTVYSPVSGPLLNVNAEVGQRVRAGDMLFTFNTTEMERNLKTAAATNNLTGLQGQAAINASNEAAQKAGTYQNDINSWQQQKAAAQARANEAAMGLAAWEMAPYYRDNTVTNGVQLGNFALELDKLDREQPLDEAKAALYTEIRLYYDELVSMQNVYTSVMAAAQEEIAKYEGLIQQAETGKEAAEQGIMDENGRAQLGQQAVSPQLTLEAAQEMIEVARAGVTAPISGVITAMEAQKGSAASQYAPLCVIESLSKVDVRVSLSRYDLERVKAGQSAVVTSLGKEYAAHVSKVDAVATTETTQSGVSTFVSAVISIDNPDDNLTLGIEAEVSISTGRKDDVLTVPISAVNNDVDGAFCYVVENGVAVRKTVEVGISSDIDVEILDGLAEGDELILASQAITAGESVTPSAGPVAAADEGGGMMGVMIG